MGLEGDGSELGIGYLDAPVILVVDQLGVHAQPGDRGGGTDVVEDGLVAAQRVAGPVLADLAEQAMVDRVPLGGAAGVVADGDGEVVRVNEAGLEGIFEAADAGSVAAAGVGEDQQFGGAGVALAAFALPPSDQVVSSEVGGVVGGADDDEAVVGGDVVDAVGDGDAVSLGAEVVVVDGLGRLSPGVALVLEITDELALFGIDADDRQAAPGEFHAL